MLGSQLVAKSAAWLPSCFVEWHLDHGFPLDFQYFYLDHSTIPDRVIRLFNATLYSKLCYMCELYELYTWQL